MANYPMATIERLQDAMNRHDLEAFVACFAPDYESEQPAHPARTFRGRDQVHKNWSSFFEGVPDFRADLLRAAQEGETVWNEWHWYGHRRDGTRLDLRGVTLFGVRSDQIVWGRPYLEETEELGADIDARMRELAGDQAESG